MRQTDEPNKRIKQMKQTIVINDLSRIFDDAIYEIVDAIKSDGNNKLKNQLIRNDKFRNHYLFIVYESKWFTGRLAELSFMCRFTLKDAEWEALMQASTELKSRLKRMGRLIYHEI